ncbi:unnamed protein product [Diamesa serratosioi]
MTVKVLVFALIGLSLNGFSIQTSPLYSLQPAVEALNQREAQLAYNRDDSDDFIDEDDSYWNEEYQPNSISDRASQVPSNKMLANYLARENPEYDDFVPQSYGKRSMFRERDTVAYPPSVFRERVPSSSNREQQQQHDILAEKFLKAIDQEREDERQEEYKEQLHKLWDRYQQQEGEIEKELFNDNGNELQTEYYEDAGELLKKKRQGVGEIEVAPAYWVDKRSPLLPWLPASRKKRFPVAKRSSSSMTKEDIYRSASGTDEKVVHDLQGIFGMRPQLKAQELNFNNKKKRSSDISEDNSPPAGVTTKDTDDIKAEPKVTHQVASEIDSKDNKNKRSDDDESDDDADNEKDDGAADDEDEEDKKKKKKREVKHVNNLEVVKEEQLQSSRPTEVNKRSVQWSKLFAFGLDRKKKSMSHGSHGKVNRMKRQQGYLEDDYEDTETEWKNMRDEDKLEAMEKKLKVIEKFIIHDVANKIALNERHLNALSFDSSFKDKLAEGMQTASSIEKMRKAVEKLRKTIENDKAHESTLLQVGYEAEQDKKEKAKRVAIKKEKAEFKNHDHEIDNPTKKISPDSSNNNELDEVSKKKKKRAGKIGNMIEAPMSESLMGGMAQNDCPLLDAMERRCRGIDILSGDLHQNLLETCGVHQLCYLCGESQAQCDYDYFTETKSICGHNIACLKAARQAITILRNLPGSHLGPKECSKNACLVDAIRSIGY